MKKQPLKEANKIEQSIEEMLATHTKEEWHEWIDKEMEELGLEFDYTKPFEKDFLFKNLEEEN